MPDLTSTSISLEAFGKEDFERLIGWIDSRDIHERWTGRYFSYPLNTKELELYLEGSTKIPTERTVFRVKDTSQDKIVGHAEISHIWPGLSGRLSRILIGDESLRGKGLGVAITKELLRYGFSNYGFDHMDLGVSVSNDFAKRCYKKAGFKIVGLWEDMFDTPENPFSIHWMSIQKSEFNPLV